jgi:hypothetical protein
MSYGVRSRDRRLCLPRLLLLLHQLPQPRHRISTAGRATRPSFQRLAQADQPSSRVYLAGVLNGFVNRRAALGGARPGLSARTGSET